MLGRLLAAPALHFLCLGTVLLVASQSWAPRRAGAGALSDDELLYREAIALGVDREDPAVRERLARLGGFVGEDTQDEVTLEAEARRLGLARSDLVVKRHLALVMRLAAERLRPEDVPTDETLRAYLTAHAAALAVPARTRFAHVYVSEARHGPRTATTAEALLVELRRRALVPEGAGALGDPFVSGSEVGPATATDLDRRFGPGFAARLADIEPGAWAGPVRSAYGLHLVWIAERLPAATPSLEAMHGQILHRVLRERREARASARIATLRAR